MRILQSECVILKQKPFKEKDRLVTFITRDHGRMTGIAKGSATLTSRGVGNFEPLTHGVIYFYDPQGRDLVTIRKLDPLPPSFFPQNASDYERFLVASYFTELVGGYPTTAGESNAFFTLLLEGLAGLMDPKADRPMVRLDFEMGFLRLMGVAPQWGHCMACGRGLFVRQGSPPEPSRWVPLRAQPHTFDAEGGLRLPDCHPVKTHGVCVLSPQALEFVGLWLDPEHAEPPTPEQGVVSQVQRALSLYLTRHVEKVPKSLALLG